MAHVLAGGDGEFPKLELWLRSMVQHSIAGHLRLHDAAGDAADISVVAADAIKLATDLAGLADPLVNGCFRPVGEDASAFGLLLQSIGSEVVDIACLESAATRMRTKRMENVYTAMTKGEVGPEALARSAALLQVSGKDDAADEKLRLAQSIICGDRVPRLIVTESAPAFANFQCIQDMKVVELLDEVVGNLSEAMSSWSAVRKAAKLNELQNIILSMLGVVALVGEGLVLDLLAIVNSTLAGKLIFSHAKDVSSWDQPEARVAFKQLSNRLSGYMIEDADLIGFVERLRAWLGRLPADVYLPSAVKMFNQDILDLVVNNCAACSQVEGVLRSMATVLDSDVLRVEDFVAEFANAGDAETQARSRLPQAATLQSQVDGLSEMVFELKECFGPLTLDVDYGEGVERLEVGGQLADELICMLPSMPIHQDISTLVSGSVTHVLRDLVTSVSLNRVHCPRMIPPEASLADQLALFVDTAAEAAQPAAEWLQHKNPQGPWAADATFNLAKKLLLALTEKMPTVGVAPLCTIDATDEMSSTTNLAGVEAVLDMLGLVAKISSLFSWVRVHHSGATALAMAAECQIVGTVEMALTALFDLLKGADVQIEKGVCAQVKPIQELAWIFQ